MERIGLSQLRVPATGVEPTLPAPVENDMYLDDGTNTESGLVSWRQYRSSTWHDVGLQGIGEIAIDGGEFVEA